MRKCRRPEELEFEFGGRAGVNWFRSGQNYMSYDYYADNQADVSLERDLERLVGSKCFES